MCVPLLSISLGLGRAGGYRLQGCMVCCQALLHLLQGCTVLCSLRLHGPARHTLS